MYTPRKKQFKMSSLINPISTNYIKKIQEEATLNEDLRTMLVNFHEDRYEITDWKTPYRLEMKNPKLSVSVSWHNTIMSALEYANILTGDFIIQFNQRILTLQECQAIQQCEEGELHISKGCSIACAIETRELREKELYEEIAQEELEYSLEKNEEHEELREKAMKEILEMSPKEFQTRLLDGTLPNFPRETPQILTRDTCHEKRLLTEKEFENPGLIINYGEYHRNKLRYMSAKQYKYQFYSEFWF